MRRWTKRLQILALLGIALFVTTGLTDCTTDQSARTTATFVVAGLPSDGTISPGQTLTLNYTGTRLAPSPYTAAPHFGVLRHVIVVLKYEPVGECGVVKIFLQKSPYCDSVEAWSQPILDDGKPIIVRITLPKDIKPGSTVEVISNAHSEEARAQVKGKWLVGVSFARASEKTTTLRVVGGGGGGGGGGTNPVASIFPHNAPTDLAQAALVDARLSSDPNGRTLSFSWDLNGDGRFGDPTDGGTGSTPADGLAYVNPTTMASQPNQYQPVAVKVTTSDGRSATTQTRIRMNTGMGNGSIVPSPSSAPPGTAITLTLTLPPGVEPDPGNKATACLDFDGDGVYGDAIVEFTSRTPQTYTVTARSDVGYHRVGAVFWYPNANETCVNRDGDAAADRYAPGFTQLVSNAYRTSGASGRQGTAKQYVANSSLRLIPLAIPVAGKTGDRGVIRGMVTRGTFTFKTPGAAKKVKRPSGLADLARGTYVARAATSTVSGTGEAGKAVYTGVSTVLLRGRNGTLACLTADASIAASTFTMRGGTKNASRLAFTAVLTQTPFTLPTVEELVRQLNAKTPPKAKPINGKGPVSASTGKKARGLNGACKSLQKYLR